MNQYLILLLALTSAVHCRLVFPKGLDVGYVVSDDDKRNDEQILKDEEEGGHMLSSGLHKTTIKRDLVDDWTWNPDVILSNDNAARRTGRDNRVPEGMEDKKHGVVMGVKNTRCDNGQVNLTRDWYDDPVNHTCYTPKERIKINRGLEPYYHCDDVPKHYYPKHYCMFVEIHYNSTLPTYGPHRPLWPLWGEYKFVPTHRWLHALEHGAVVMLYHPCTEPILVRQLKKILSSCIYKHVISPYNLLPTDRPLTLIAWGCYMQMAFVDVKTVTDFIKEKSMHGPEGRYAKLGKYTHGLLREAIPPLGSNENDTVICPGY